MAQDAINDARSICMREYGSAPDVSIYGDPTFTFAYVPSHLHHMIFELVKNSLRAVQDRFEDADDEPPPIRCVVCACAELLLLAAAVLSSHVVRLNARVLERPRISRGGHQVPT